MIYSNLCAETKTKSLQRKLQEPQESLPASALIRVEPLNSSDSDLTVTNASNTPQMKSCTIKRHGEQNSHTPERLCTEARGKQNLLQAMQILDGRSKTVLENRVSKKLVCSVATANLPDSNDDYMILDTQAFNFQQVHCKGSLQPRPSHLERKTSHHQVKLAQTLEAGLRKNHRQSD